MHKQEAFQQLRHTITARKTLLARQTTAGSSRRGLEQIRVGLQQAEEAVISFRNFILELDDRYLSERELLAANKAMVLRAEYRKLASVDSLSEYQGLEFEADVLEDQFLILAKGV